MGFGSEPDTGNIEKAAKIDNQYAADAARNATYADRPDQFNPYGSVTWGQQQVIDPATGKPTTKWTQNQGVNQDIQKLMDTQGFMMQGNADLAGGMMNRITDEMGTAANFDQFGDVIQQQYDPTAIRGAAEDAAYQRQANRLDPQYAQSDQALEVKLRNQGLNPSDKAYQDAMGNYGRSKNDAYEQARLSSSAQGMGEANQLWNQQQQGTQTANALRDKQIQEYIAKRGFSLNEQKSLNQGNSMKDINELIT
jgi:hypothetical protein